MTRCKKLQPKSDAADWHEHRSDDDSHYCDRRYHGVRDRKLRHAGQFIGKYVWEVGGSRLLLMLMLMLWLALVRSSSFPQTFSEEPGLGNTRTASLRNLETPPDLTGVLLWYYDESW